MANERDDAARGVRRFYLAAWRWHFYAGVCVVPFVFLLAASGLGMLVGESVDRYLQRDLIEAAPTGDVLSPSVQAAAVAATHPDFDLLTFRVAAGPGESTRIDVSPKHVHAEHGGHRELETKTVFVDPYTAEVLGELDPNRTVYAWAKSLHGTLLLGTFGDYVIESVAGLGVLLIASGLYLWWPRDRGAVRQALLPSFSSGGPRRWRNLHGAMGAWLTPFLLFFFLSGLAWTPFWGGQLVQAWSSLPGEQFDGPLSDATHAELGHGARQVVPWAVEQTPMPVSGSPRRSQGIATTGSIALDDVVAYARASGFSTFRVHWPRTDNGVWTVAATTIAGDTQRLTGDRIVHLDARTGNVLGEVRFAEYSPMGKLMAAGIPLHQGDTGAVNLALNVLICLAVITMSGAAIAAWWNRRPAAAWRLLPPPLPRNQRTWRVAVLLMLTLSLAFPLAAATIVAVLAIDFLLLSRVRMFEALFE